MTSLTSCTLLSWLARSAPRSYTTLQALGPLLPSWSIRSSRAPVPLGSPHAWQASRSRRAPRSRLSRVPNTTGCSRMAHRPLGSRCARGSHHSTVSLLPNNSRLSDKTNESHKPLFTHRSWPSRIPWLPLQAIQARPPRKPLPSRLTLQAWDSCWPHGSFISLRTQLSRRSRQASGSRLTLHAFRAIVPWRANVSWETLRSRRSRKPK